MRPIFRSKNYFQKQCNYALLFLGSFLFFTSGCSGKDQAHKTPTPVLHPTKNVDSLAKDWRAQVRKNHINPYETSTYPHDKLKKNKKVSPIDNDDYYGKFPHYNPEDDNMYLDPKHYPLYFDN